MRIDIRENEDEEVGEILFGDRCCIANDNDGNISYDDFEGDISFIRKSDIDNLIKALQKAKELWT